MEATVLKLWKASKKDKDFDREMLIADNDKRPGMFAPEVEKIAWAGVYYGWLVGKYGCTSWNQHI